MSETMERYTERNGTFYDARTSDAVIDAIERARLSGQRVRLFCGDTETGESWAEENDVAGTIGRSAGPIKIPLLIANSRSLGGDGILDHCIVAILTSPGAFAYRHAGFSVGEWEFLHSEWADDPRPFLVHHNGQSHAAFIKEASARRYVEFMCGERMGK